MLLEEFNNLGLVLTVEEALTEINKNTLNPLTLDDVFIFKVKLCDSTVDREYDRLTESFLKEFTAKSQSLVGLYNHNWGEVEKQQIRLFKALYIDDDINIPYVLGYAYTLMKNYELIENINSGILKECSIGFNSEGHKCSICGADMLNGVCEQGHELGNLYDGNLCYRLIEHCVDSLEFSLVSVPANKNAGIIKTLTGGTKRVMKKSMFNFLKFISSKAYTEEDKQTILKAVEGIEETEEEITEEEIKSLIEENSKLKEANDALTVELGNIKAELEELKTKSTETEEVEEETEVKETEVVEKPKEEEEAEVKSSKKGLRATITPTIGKSSVTKKTASTNKGYGATINFK